MGMLTYYGHEEAEIEIMILVWLCRFEIDFPRQMNTSHTGGSDVVHVFSCLNTEKRLSRFRVDGVCWA